MAFFESFIAVCHFFLSIALKAAFAILKSLFDNKNICLEKYPNLPIYSAYKFIKLDNDDMDISHLDFDNWGDTITENIKTSVLNQINKFRYE